MASYEPLIPSSTHRNPILSCKAFSLTLSVASLICLATILSPFGRTGSDSRLVEPSPVPTGPVQTLIQQSLVMIAAAGAAAAKSQGQLNGVGEQLAVDDCVHLLDLSRDRLLDSVAAISAGAYTDARTWLSAVLTNHDTCLDGLHGPSTRPIRAQLKVLMGLGSAALSVLNAGNHARTVAVKKFQFPSWVVVKDRRLLGALGRLAEIEADVVVAKDGSGNYSTVQEAVDSAPDKGKRRYVIYVKSGTYQENVMVGKKKINVMIVGDGMNSTVITGSRNYIDGSTTFNSSTLAAVGDGFILQDICIENTAGPQKHQAVALRVGADRSVINRCQLNGYQDTLYAHSLRQFYRDSIISGTIDFIFGNAAVVFQNCTLIARLPMSNQQNLVTAQGRIDPNQNTGTTIQNCRVVPSPELVPMEDSIPSYLGRPWKNFSRTVYMESYIDGHIDPKGWKEWDGDFALDTLYYGEYANSGPGAGLAGRVNWTGYHVITDPSVAMEFTVEEMIQGAEWLSESGVEFTEGLYSVLD